MADSAATAALTAERALVARLGGGCQTPIGGLAVPFEPDLELVGVVASLDGTRVIRARSRGPATQAEALGRRVADDLLAQGAGRILEEARRGQGQSEATPP